MPFEHFILTRFNVKLPGLGAADTRKRLDPRWLERRLELFRLFCLPSVLAQSAPEFRWLVFIDPETPERWRRELRSLSGDGRLIPAEAPDGSQADFQAAVAGRLSPDATHVITTRVDSDDGLALDSVERVQGAFSGQDCQFLRFGTGFVLDGAKLYLIEREDGPFVSLVERAAGLRTVLCGHHEFLREVGPVRFLEGPPAWLQVVHGGNLKNRRRGIRLPLSSAALSRRFLLPPGLGVADDGSPGYWLDRTRGRARSWLRSIKRRVWGPRARPR